MQEREKRKAAEAQVAQLQGTQDTVRGAGIELGRDQLRGAILGCKEPMPELISLEMNTSGEFFLIARSTEYPIAQGARFNLVGNLSRIHKCSLRVEYSEPRDGLAYLAATADTRENGNFWESLISKGELGQSGLAYLALSRYLSEEVDLVHRVLADANERITNRPLETEA